MKKLSKFRTGCLFSLALIFVFAFGFSTAQAQTTAFNFQGRLNDGSNPANGRYDLQFRLYDALTGDNIIGAAITKPNLMLINGVFSTQLDFGAPAFSGANRFIEIRLRSAGTENGYVILGPRQQILSVPYTIRSLRATLTDDATHAVNADNATYAVSATNATNAQNAVNATNATNAQTAVNSQQLGGVAASQYIQQGGNGQAKFTAVIVEDVHSNYSVSSCYNSTLTGSAMTAPPCGLTINHYTAGGFGLTFNFELTNHPALVSPYNYGYANSGAYFQQPANPTPYSVDLRTFYAQDTDNKTSDIYAFSIVIF